MKNNKSNNKKRKKGQVTIFIIIAIIIVAGIIGVVLLRDRIKPVVWPREVLPVYEYFLSCIEDETKIAASIMGSQAGYLELPEFEPGSEYMPFSSQLNFLGTGVPYWYYVSSNGISKEQVPSKEKMQAQLEDYLEDRIKECDFLDFEMQGFVVEVEESEIEVEIKNREIKVEVEMPLTISYGNTVVRQTSHEVEVKSRLGKFYDIARKIYDAEQANLFLENYGVDVLRLYAPVTGVELTCSPKVWLQNDVKDNLRRALEANVQAIKIKGNYYSLSDKHEYFVRDIGEKVRGEGESINFLYSKNWPTKIEIYPDEDPMLAEPVGLEEGLGLLGFCYVPYHFVYDIAYPVLVQIYDAEEMFQFPIAVVIDKNKPLEGLATEALPEVVPKLCEHKLTQVEVYTYNSKIEPVEASIAFKCFDTKCDIGKTELVGEDAYLRSLFPQCVNGFIIVRAEGYAIKKYMLSTVKSGEANIILDKLYTLNLNITIDNKPLKNENAIIHFQGKGTRTIAYPEQKQIQLTEGSYNITLNIYKDSSITLRGFTKRTCIDVPKKGILGIFGVTEERCFNMEIPSQIVSYALAGGGKAVYYFTESELESSTKLEIRAESLLQPTSIEQLQENYDKIKDKTLWLTLS